jgi:hypothetical protein
MRSSFAEEMKPPPVPLTPCGLSPTCPDVLGTALLIQCLRGWGWTQIVEGKTAIFADETLAMGRVQIEPEAYIDFTAPRSGITGRVVQIPAPYELTRFVAYIMTDGVDYNFTDNIAPAWRVILGTGGLDLDSAWIPILAGEDTLFGYGTVGQDADWLRRSGHLFQRQSEQVVPPNGP